jgi:dodecin
MYPQLSTFYQLRRHNMAGSTYKIIELVGTSDQSWEEAASIAIETAGESLKDLRIAEVTKLDVTIEEGKIKAYRTRLSLSFKYQK